MKLSLPVACALFAWAANSSVPAQTPAAAPVPPPVEGGALPPANIEPPLAPAESWMEGLPDLAPAGAAVEEPPSTPVPPVAEVPAPEAPPVEGTEGAVTGVTARSGWKKNVFPHFRLGGYYDDNIFIQNTNRQGDFIGFAGFGLRLGLGEVRAPLYTFREARNVPTLYEAPPQPFGNFLMADYSGTFFAFANHSSEDSYDQDALLSMGWTGAKLSLGFEARFQSLSGGDVDVGDRVRREIYHAGLNGWYELSEKSSLEANFSYTNTQYENLINSAEWINEDWFNYQITGKIKLSPGIGLGVLQIQDSPDQPYARLLLRAKYEATAKLSFDGRIGLEYRDVQTGSSFRNNPVFGLGVTYVPFDGTTLSLDGYRTAEASATRLGEDYTRTGADLKVRQRFLQRFYFSVTGGYENLRYEQVASTAEASRRDHYFFGRAAVAFDVTRWCNAELFYNLQRDSSSLAENSFTDNQVGLEFDFAF